MSVRSALGLVLVLALGSTGCVSSSVGVRQQEDKILQPSSYVAVGRFRTRLEQALKLKSLHFLIGFPPGSASVAARW